MGKTTATVLFIDCLKKSYPNAIVAYFICKRGRPRLGTARDIIRTIAFQCTSQDPHIKSHLENLRRSGNSMTDESSEISSVIRKLLLEPLNMTQKDVFMVFDTVDEIEKEKEMEVLLRSLAELARCRSSSTGAIRILILTRPHMHVNMLMSSLSCPSTIMEYHDNERDIQTYLVQVIKASKQLQIRFEKEGIDPLAYFAEKSDGTFIWVARALEELEKIKSTEEFRLRLNALAEGSGNIESLYIALLSGYSDIDRRRINSTLQWVATAQRPLSVVELKQSVEWSLHDEIYDFPQFLDTECSCILRCTMSPSRVELVDQRLRSILIDSKRWPDYVDLRLAHSQAALLCLKCLLDDNKTTSFDKYATQFWTDHLSQSMSKGSISLELLSNAFLFFTSNRLAVWIKAYLVKRHNVHMTSRYEFEEPDWRALLGWLKAVEVPQSGQDRQVSAALQWRRSVLHANDFAEYLAKAAVSVWLSDHGDDFIGVSASFHLALQYYRQQESKYIPSDFAMHLIDTRFRPMIEWAGLTNIDSYDQKNVGVAYASLGRYSEAIECYQNSQDRNNPILWEYLGHMYHAKGQYQLEIEAYETARQKDPLRPRPFAYLACAYKVAGDISKASSFCREAIALDSSLSWLGQLIDSEHDLSMIPSDEETYEFNASVIDLRYFISFIRRPFNPRVITKLAYHTDSLATSKIYYAMD